ncbi:MAG: hypothetical protein V2I38_05995 [Alcanivoracaceae bacterium]|jgi:hypothetical protein|nr:hypothetical protein [Alcanivoracaceae bacterium]
MFKTEAEKRVEDIRKELIRVVTIDAAGSMLAGLGLYAKFAANGNAFHSFLNDQGNVNAMLAVGFTIMLWGVSRLVTLGRERAKLRKEHCI